MNVSGTQGLGGGSSALFGQAAQSTLGKDDFLKLLVAQLAHQDPLQPMENSEFVAQLAQFSGLEQMVDVNSNLGLLQIAQASASNSQVASLIGKQVEARGDMVQLSGRGSAAINFDLAATAKEVRVKIFDGRGNLVRTMDASSKPAGLNTITWDGKDNMGNQMTAGRYKVEVSAKDSQGQGVVASPQFSGVVTGVKYENGVPVLEVGTTTVPISDVVAVRTPTSPTP